MKRKGIGVIFIILAVAGLFTVAYLFFRPKTPDYSNRLKDTYSNVETPAPKAPRDWPVYVSSKLGIKFKHPPDITPSIEKDSSIVIVKMGPDQLEGTELFNGLSLRISSQKLAQGKTLKQVAEEAEQQSQENAEINKTLKSTTIAGLTGYTYTASRIGVHGYTYLPQGETNYLLITDSTTDYSNQGYEKTVGQILSSIEFTE